MIILGNKVDKDNRNDTQDEGVKYSKNKKLTYFETSAINMKNVNEAFDKMIKKILKTQDMKSFNKSNLKFILKIMKLINVKNRKGVVEIWVIKIF